MVSITSDAWSGETSGLLRRFAAPPLRAPETRRGILEVEALHRVDPTLDIRHGDLFSRATAVESGAPRRPAALTAVGGRRS